MKEQAWSEEFPPTYYVPCRIRALVSDGVLEDLSARGDGCPSFGARLAQGKEWVRLFVEHREAVARRARRARFTVLLQADPSRPDGRVVLETEEPEDARRLVLAIVKRGRPSGASAG